MKENTLYFLDFDPSDGSWYAQVFTSLEDVKKELFDWMNENRIKEELPADFDYEDELFSFKNGMGFHIQKVDDESYKRLCRHFKAKRSKNESTDI